MDAIAIEVSVITRAAEDGKLYGRMVLSEVSKGTGREPDALQCLEELARAVQEYVWGERGI